MNIGMIGTGTGACPARTVSPTRARNQPPSSPVSLPSPKRFTNTTRSMTRSSSPRMALSPRTSPPPEYFQKSPSVRANLKSPPTQNTSHLQTSQILTPNSKANIGVSGDKCARRDGRICVHADTNNNVVLYPSLMYDPDGELIVAQTPNTYGISAVINQQLDKLNRAGAACGLVVALNKDSKDPSKRLRAGTFFQVSPSRAIAAFHTAFDALPGRPSKARELWVTKSCSINHWDSLFSSNKSRAKYFRKARVVPGFEAERQRLLQFYGDNLVEKCCGIPPRTPIDFVILELPNDFRDDPYLLPIPRSKIRTVKKVAVVSYSQHEYRDENNRANVYHCTAGIPLYDGESRFLHSGSKSLSPGLLVASNDNYICSELSLGDGSVGGPLIPLTLAHYFWGLQVCCFYDAEVAAGAARSRNYNVQLNFYHPALLVLYEKFVLQTLNEVEQKEVKQNCYAG